MRNSIEIKVRELLKAIHNIAVYHDSGNWTPSAKQKWPLRHGAWNRAIKTLVSDFTWRFFMCSKLWTCICFDLIWEHFVFHLEVLENPGENWELLVEGFLEYRRRDPVASGIAALHTPKGQETMTEILREMVQTINGPIVIAWDTQEQKVSWKMLLKRNQPHH